MKLEFSFPQRLLLCFLSAVLVWFSFPNFICKTLAPPTAFLGWVALVPLFVAFHEANSRQGAFLGLFFGFAQFGGVLYWIAFLQAAHYLSGPAWFILVFYLSLFSLFFGWLYRFSTNRLGWRIWLAPVFWVGLEYIRGSRPWGGFSWGELGYSQAPYPEVLTFTSWAGVYGLTFLMVSFNAWIAQWFVKYLEMRREGNLSIRRFLWIGLGIPATVLAVLIIRGTLIIKETPLQKAGRVAMLQPSIDQDVKWSKENEAATYRTLSRLVKVSEKEKPDLIIWPETAAPTYLLWTPDDLARVASIVRGSKTAHLVGCLDAVRKKKGDICCYNAAVQFKADGKAVGCYHKRHLVPFGEFVPFQKYISFLGPVVGDLGSFDSGDSYEKFQVKGFTYTPMICYEVIFPGDVYKAFQTGADALVNISNDAWYGRTASPYQHAMMAVVRAAEERKPLLRAANTGICLATDPFGRILCSSHIFDQTSLSADVILAPQTSRTFYSRWGNWLPHLCCLATAFIFILACFKRKRTGLGPTPVMENHAP